MKPHFRHSREGGNPEKHWMPDQVRHDKRKDGNDFVIPACRESFFSTE
jgi:hypothetical protein